MARFIELLRCVGVDELARPFPGMVVPLGGSNFVALTERVKDLRVASPHGGLKIEEIDASIILPTQLAMIKTMTAVGTLGPMGSPEHQAKKALMPLPTPSLSRFFRIHGNQKIPASVPALVQATSGRKVEATLNVVVLERMTIKIAIRNVQIVDATGKRVFHAKKPCDPKWQHEIMNDIWRPQTNMTFDLVSSEPVLVDIRDRSTREELGRVLKLPDPSTAEFLPERDINTAREALKKHRVPVAHLTFFLVDKLQGGISGATNVNLGMAFIEGEHGSTTFAHEAGHFLSGRVVKGEWDSREPTHTFNPNLGENDRELMKDGGAGWKIPFGLVKEFRGFFDRHPVH